jgi:hypothetical protein
MRSLWTAIRALVYSALFFLLWGWVALSLRPYDARLGGALGTWAVLLGWLAIAAGAELAASCVWVFVRRDHVRLRRVGHDDSPFRRCLCLDVGDAHSGAADHA